MVAIGDERFGSDVQLDSIGRDPDIWEVFVSKLSKSTKSEWYQLINYVWDKKFQFIYIDTWSNCSV